jgi:hypothetical protein
MKRRLLFTFTGFLMYYIGVTPLNLALYRICPPPSDLKSFSAPCIAIYGGLLIIAVVGFRVAVKEWERAGKWLWLKFVPSWA